MDLGTIVQTVWKETDELVLRQYAKARQYIPEEKVDLAAVGLCIAGMGFCSYGSTEFRTEVLKLKEFSSMARYMVASNSLVVAVGVTELVSIVGKYAERDLFGTDPKDNVGLRFLKLWTDTVRLPSLACGAAAVALTSKDMVYDYMVGFPIMPQDYSIAMMGAGFVCFASSMYLRDADPKILEKESLFDRASHWFKERFGKREMHPGPARVLYGLDDQYKQQDVYEAVA